MKKLDNGIPKGKLPNYTIGVISDEELYANSYSRQMWGEYYNNEYDTGMDLTYGEVCKKDFLAGVEYQKKRSFTYEQVELITNEMVNWALDNIGNQNPESGKKFDEIVKNYKDKTIIEISEVIKLENRLKEINKLPLHDIIFLDENKNVIEIDKSIIDEFIYTGLNNSDFIISEFYKH